MEKENTDIARENEMLSRLLSLEDLAVKKAKIYSKLLTEQALAQDMESLAARHLERKEKLERLIYGKKCKDEKKDKDGGADAD